MRSAELQLSTSLSTVFFFISDVNDVDGALRIQTADGSSATNFATIGTDGNLYFVGITSSGPIGSIQWINNSQNDGFGLDDFGTAQSTPEPATSLATGTGLLLLATTLRLRVWQVSKANPPNAQAMPRSLSSPLKKPIVIMRKYRPGGKDGRPSLARYAGFPWEWRKCNVRC